VFLASFLASSDSHALIACAPAPYNWYCYTSNSTSPPVAFNTTSHGSGCYCWCYAGNGWVPSGNFIGTNCANGCNITCPDVCDA
jgi:hypothetical protein